MKRFRLIILIGLVVGLHTNVVQAQLMNRANTIALFLQMGDGIWSLYTIEADSYHLNLLDSSIHPSNFLSDPVWSADRQWIAYTNDRQLFVINVAKEITKQITHFDRHLTAASPRWSPDGRTIIYDCSVCLQQDCGNHHWHICTIAPDGSDFRQLTSDDSNNYLLGWRSQGGEVSYWSCPSGDAICNFRIMKADGSQPSTLFSRNKALDAAWLGEQIVISDGEEDHQVLYKMNKDGSERVQLTELHTSQSETSEYFVRTTTVDVPVGDDAPLPSPNGHYIAFMRHIRSTETKRDLLGQHVSTHDKEMLGIITSDGKSVLELEAGGSDFASMSISWSPDGNKFAFSDGFNTLFILDVQTCATKPEICKTEALRSFDLLNHFYPTSDDSTALIIHAVAWAAD